MLPPDPSGRLGPHHSHPDQRIQLGPTGLEDPSNRPVARRPPVERVGNGTSEHTHGLGGHW
eukprot:10190492-Alexandrium_andersonii.AAC.1